MTSSSPVPVIPSITGNPGLDSLIRGLIVVAASFVTAWIVTTTKNTDPNFAVSIMAAVTGVLLVIATMAWGYIHSAITAPQAVVDHAVASAISGTVTPSIYAKASIPQIRQLETATAKKVLT